VEATPEEGAVQLSMKKGDGEGMVIEIKDHGPGIPPEFLERIFDPFFSQKEKGSGLGLSIAANIMQAHGGTIKVQSEAGQGACFQLFFPSAELSGPTPRNLQGLKANTKLKPEKELTNESYSCC